MNRTPTAAGIAAIFAVAVLGAGPARAQGSVEDQIKKLEKDRAAAVVKGDVAAIAGQTAEDYTLINANGQLSGKAQTMDAIKTGNIKLTANELSDLSVRVYGNHAVSRVKLKFKVVAQGLTVQHGGWTTDLWRRHNGRWKLVWSQTTAIPNHLDLFIQSLQP